MKTIRLIFRPLTNSRKAYFIATLPAALLLVLATNASAAVLHVDVNSTNPTPPFTNWITAATNIQDAVDVAGAGDQVLVANGTYQTGNRLTTDGVQNRVAITNAITLQSVNGSAVTSIDGGQAVRCVSLASGAVLSGFTLTKGKGGNGGGVACASTNEQILDCQLVSNSGILGGGVYGGSLSNCTLSGNVLGSGNDTRGGGAYGSILNYCTLTYNRNGYNVSVFGSGAFGCTLNFCTINNNVANSEWSDGAGICSSTANNCTISGNSGTYVSGGGAAYSSLSNCVITGNNAVEGGAGYSSTFVNCTLSNNVASWGGGSYWGTLHNCIVIGNTAYQDGGGASRSSLFGCTVVGNHATYSGGGVDGDGYGAANSIILNNTSTFNEPNYNGSTTLNHCCTTPLPPSGVGNIATDPLFVNYGASDLHLQTNSPCIEAGNNAYVPTTITHDFEGKPRIVGNNVDMGAHEFQTPTFLSTQPQSQTNYAEYTTVFFSAGVSPLPFTYQWQFNGTNIDGATNSTLTITNLQPSNAGSYRVGISNALVMAQSSNAVLTVISPPPALLSQPLDLITDLGSNAVFSVSVFSPYPVTYQWQRDSTNLSNGGPMGGTTNSTLVITGVQVSDATTYRVVVSNKYGAVTSSVASLTVLGPPVLFSQPADTVAMVADLTYLTLSMSSTGAPPLTVQWKKDGTNLVDDGRITGSSSPTLTIPMQQPTDSGVYSVLVTNAYGSISSTNARIVVVPLLRWSTWPSTPPLESTNFIEIATGSDARGWNGGSFNLGLSADGTVTEWNYALPPPAEATNVVAIAAGSYFGLALRKDGTIVGWGENGSGQSASPGALTNAVGISAGTRHSLALLRDGTISAWGDSTYGETNAPLGATNIVAIAAGGDFNLALRQDGEVIAWGRNDASQTDVPPDVTNVVAIAAGSSHAVALRSDGSITGWGQGWSAPPARATNAIRLAAGDGHNLALLRDGTVVGWGRNDFAQTFITPGLTNVVSISANEWHSMAMVQHGSTPSVGPALVQQPLNLTLPRGASGAMRAYAVGSSPLAYQWYLNTVPVTGETNCWLWLNELQPAQAGDYRLVVTNNYGAVTSQVAVVTELPWAAIAAQPVSQAAVVSSNATFSVGMYGRPPFQYQWYFNGSPLTNDAHLSGATAASLSVSSVQIADGGSYSVVVTNGFNAVTSTWATLTVLVPAGITNQPVDQSVLLNSNAVFAVAATGTGALTYQWLKDGTNLSDGGTISGSATPTLAVAGAQTNDNGSYQAVVSNAYGSSTSSVATLTVYVPVLVTSQPASKAVLLGSSASFAVTGTGTALGYRWYFNNTPLVDGGRISGSASSSLTVSNVQSSDAGAYWALVSNLLSSATSLTASLTPLTIIAPSVRYVDMNGTSPAPPYLNWATAATTIQDAIDAAVDGDQILVADGVYRAGGRVVYGSLTNRVAVNKAVGVRSVNGAAAAMIQGGSPAGDSAVRCVYLANKASMAGFTLANGAVRSAGDLVTEQSGGGAWCESINSLLLNCLILSNTAPQSGGGVYLGTCSNCYLAFNSATNGGGAFGGVLNSCTLATNAANNGGGACSNTLNGCSLIANVGTNWGGGAYGSILNNCTVARNTNSNQGGGMHSCIASACSLSNNVCSGSYGGGAYNSRLSNCLVLGNTARQGGGGYNCVMNYCRVSGNAATGGAGGGAYGGTFNNCLICSNSASGPSGTYQSTLNNCTVIGHTNGYALYGGTARNCISYYNAINYAGSAFLTSSCTSPLPQGAGNITNAPVFVDLPGGNFRLQTNSPCINSGNNVYVTNSADLDGRPRIAAGTVDMGAYEFQGAGAGEFIGWLQQNGLATDGSADFSDSDGDAMNNWQEWIASTNPTNALSRLLLSATPGSLGVRLSWPSTSGRTYFIERSSNLAARPAFAMLVTNVPGQNGTTTYTDSTAIGPGPFFYRVGVQGPEPFWLVPFSRISFAWLQQYGLPTDGSADITDPDADGMNNWQEWVSGTDPTNSLSVLRMLAATNSVNGIVVSWQSVAGKMYYLQRGTNLLAQPGLTSLWSNILGQAGTTSILDTSANPAQPRFYRVGIQ